MINTRRSDNERCIQGQQNSDPLTYPKEIKRIEMLWTGAEISEASKQEEKG